MRLKRRPSNESPPIFADLLIETPGGPVYRVDIDTPGWLADTRPIMDVASRIGLILRGKKNPAVWLTTNGGEVEYLSRVKGQIDAFGERRIRVAGVRCGDGWVWLHSDGWVEVAKEPTYREV